MTFLDGMTFPDAAKSGPNEDKLTALRKAARAALEVLENLDEQEMARLRGRADTAIELLLAALRD